MGSGCLWVWGAMLSRPMEPGKTDAVGEGRESMAPIPLLLPAAFPLPEPPLHLL